MIRRAIVMCPLYESDAARQSRRRRWLAAALRDAYDLGWLPETVTRNLAAVHVDRDRQAVILTLRSGTRLVDRLDRIDVIGSADDVTIGELAAAVQRRGWDAVELHGDPAFRRSAAMRLQMLEPPVAVVDNPLSEADQVALDAFRQRHRRTSVNKDHGFLPLCLAASRSEYDGI